MFTRLVIGAAHCTSRIAASITGKNISLLSRNKPIPRFSHTIFNHTNRALFHSTMASVNDDYVLPNEQPVVTLECKTAFDALTKVEKLYAHYLSQACWNGSLIVLIQTSPESPFIFTLLMRVFSEEPISELTKRVSAVLSEDEIKAIFIYASVFFANNGNYKGFGDSKFIPNLPVEQFEAFIKNSAAFNNAPEEISSLWEYCREPIYSIYDGVKSLGYPDKGVTTYFSSNYTSEDVELVTNFMKEEQMEAYNNRALKIVSEGGIPLYQIVLASINDGLVKRVKTDEAIFEIVKGDYSPILKLVNENLAQAKLYATTDDEKEMLYTYMKSFETGALDYHKDGSRFWIRNKNPIIETYIGFIETYRDPQGSRGEFEGFVAMVNKEMSKKFTALVDNAESLLSKLPWPRTFEKDQFQKPDFTSLDVLTFGGSAIPAGINIPNYDEIRQNEGFKNVSLGNVIPSGFKDSPFPFLSAEDKDLVIKYAVDAFEVQVGLHELLGHGSGKLFHCSANSGGVFDFDTNSVTNPLDGEKIKSWYGPGETYDSVFSSLGSSYEECRAECVGLYLSLIPEVVKIFVKKEEDIDNVIYVNWLLLVTNGVEKALENYQPQTKKWLQAHSQARFVISRVLLEAEGDLLAVTELVENEKLLITLNRNKLQTVGAKAIKDFLLKLQVYKSTANKTEAEKMYNAYSEVSDGGKHPWARWRSIVLKHKTPRRIFVQSNTIVKGNNEVELKTYNATLEDNIQSWVDRFAGKTSVFSSLIKLAKKNIPHFKY